MTPMQEQYNRIKNLHSDAILLFRMGDFYEVFNDDAVEASKILGITLTSRGKGEKRTPMAGIPYHALPNYLPKLVEAGVKIAIAEQTEEPKPGQLVERKVTKVITPGTVVDENSLDSSKNNYLASIFFESKKENFYVAYADLSTGEFVVFSSKNQKQVVNELKKINPAEVLVCDGQIEIFKEILPWRIEKRSDLDFSNNHSAEILANQFGTKNLKGFGLEESGGELIPAAALVNYLVECQKGDLKHIANIKVKEFGSTMQLDPSTIQNLELLYPINSNGNIQNTLFGVLDKCKTPMGRRELRKFILNPLIIQERIEDRLDTVEFFYSNPILIDDVQEKLSDIYDMERLTGKIGMSSVHPKDLFSLASSLSRTLEIIEIINNQGNLPTRLKYLTENQDRDLIVELIELVEKSIREDAPTSITDGGIFAEGYNERIDELRNIKKNAKSLLAQLQKKEIETTDISSLKISYNKVFGYYIEVTKTHTHKVPEHYVRKQTLANAERYITDELKELEDKILNSEDELLSLEYNLFMELREKLHKYIQPIMSLTEKVSELDVLVNFGNIARLNQYSKPHFANDKIEIQDGRHPVVEQIVKKYTSNSTIFEENSKVQILTGPNMSGKSTYIRQVALICLMSQVGSFVPARKMESKIIDRIFTRVGASDNLAAGESTFMVEMIETANILNNATDNSLIILDEVGRGTSTYDGVAIAWSIVEFIHENKKGNTLFATHYHELIDLEKKFKGIKNFNVLVEDKNKEIVFKHKIIEGGANQSYGIHVAKLAGVPKEVIDRAADILESFESHESSDSTSKSNHKKTDSKKSVPKPKKIHPEQMGLI